MLVPTAQIDDFKRFMTAFCMMIVGFATSIPTSYHDFKRTIATALNASGFMGEERGQVGVEDLPRYAVVLGVIAIIAGLSQKILVSMKEGESSAQVNTSLDKGVRSIDTLVDWLDEIALVLASVVILMLIMYVLALVSARRQGGL